MQPGRDLFDLYQALTKIDLNKDAIIDCYKKYMEFSVGAAPSQKEFILNMEEKMEDEYFIGDIVGLVRPTEQYDQIKAYELVKAQLISRM